MPPFNRPTQAILQQQNPPEMLQLNPMAIASHQYNILSSEKVHT